MPDPPKKPRLTPKGDPKLFTVFPSGSRIYEQHWNFDTSPTPKPPVTDPDAAFKAILQNARTILKPEGFRKYGQKFRRTNAFSTQFIDFQKSAWRSREDPIDFTINLAFVIHELIPEIDPKHAPYSAYHLAVRIGDYADPPRDTWWSVHGPESVESVWTELAPLLQGPALTFCNDAATRESLIKLADRHHAQLPGDTNAWYQGQSKEA